MSNPKTGKRKGRKILLLVGLLVLLGAGGGYYSYKKREQPVAVQVEKVSRKDITELVVANGRVQPVLQVVINPEVSGEIVELPVKEGQFVNKGDLLVKIKPDNYLAQVNSADANFKGALAGASQARATLEKARLEFQRIKQLFDKQLVSDSQYLEVKTTLDVTAAALESSTHQCEQAKAVLDRARDDLGKTTIVAPISGTVTRLRSQRGERVVGTAMMAGTEIMTIADLERMEARVEIGEIDVVLIKVDQKVRLEVDAFRDRKFSGVVTEIANAAKGAASSTQQQMMSSQTEATKFEVKILIQEKEIFRPGMSVTAEIETRYRTNVLAVPIMAVTTRVPKSPEPPPGANDPGAAPKTAKKAEQTRADEIVFLALEDTAKRAVVKTGISDDTHLEITEGLAEGAEIVSGGYAAVSRLLEDGKKIKREDPNAKKKRAEAKGT